MQKWTVQDRRGREIYLTAERWDHIVQRHPELRDHLDDVLNTVRYGRRRQQPANPQAFVYRRLCNSLRPPYNGVLVIVTFQFDRSQAATPNNFIVTAWGIEMRPREVKP